MGEYPLFRISGIPIVPIAAQVAGLEPLKAAKIEQAPILEITNPPGTLQSHLSNPVYKSFPAGELATAIPIKINIGIESKTNEFNPAKKVSAKTSSIWKPSKVTNRAIETKLKPKAIGIPEKSTNKVKTATII